jgi:ABC-type Fe2+-enterobactin transport system substrate-binding protein
VEACGMKLPFQKKAGTITETPGSSRECKAFTTVTGTVLLPINAPIATLAGTAILAKFNHRLTWELPTSDNGLLRSGP